MNYIIPFDYGIGEDPAGVSLFTRDFRRASEIINRGQGGGDA